jgi:hypothetical protein
MNEHDFSSRDSSQKHNLHRECDDKIQYLFSAEEHLFQSISARAPLPEILNGICCALDCQIGDVVSIISLPGDGASELAAIAMNATFFGLYPFCSEGIVAENDELFGFLEMYCSVPRNPSGEEVQLIERAKCLAAIAIKRHYEASQQGNGGMHDNRPMRGRVLEWPASMN